MQLLCIDEQPIKIEEKELIVIDPIHAIEYNSIVFYWLILLLSLLAGCSSKKQEEPKKNLYGEHIFRHSNEHFFTPPPPEPFTRAPYPWEKQDVGGFPRITKEFFRCKGNPLHPVAILKREGKEPFYYRDCRGGQRHGLPMRAEKEFIYPCLIDLLNYLQEKTNHRVIITCGHRCVEHNSYADQSKQNWGSKHMLGAEVDFYVEGMQEQPESLISLIQEYYAKTPPFQSDKSYTQFQRYEKGDLNVSTPPWYNKEILIKLYLKNEGRDFDNQHPYPYIGIQVRHDRDLNQRVIFEKAQAENYLRH